MPRYGRGKSKRDDQLRLARDETRPLKSSRGGTDGAGAKDADSGRDSDSSSSGEDSGSGGDDAATPPGPADDGEEAAPPPGAAHGPTVPPLNLRATVGYWVSVTNAFEAGWTSLKDTASGSARAFAIYARRAAGSSARSAFRALLTIQAFGQAVYRLGTAARRGREHQRGNAAAIERMQERAVAGRSLRVYSRMGCRQC